MAVVKTFAFNITQAGAGFGGQVSRDIGFPFVIKEIQLVSTSALDIDKRIRIFVSIDDDPADVSNPSGTNILSAGGGDNFFLPDSEPIRIAMNFQVPSFNRRLKVQFDKLDSGTTTVSGSITVQAL